MDVLKSLTPPYALALVLVCKNGGGLHICIDYRALNRDTIPDKYPISRIKELIDQVGSCKAKVFSALDLMKGYHQVKVRNEDKQDSFCVSPRIASVQKNAVQANKCSSHISKVNRQVVQ